MKSNLIGKLRFYGARNRYMPIREKKYLCGDYLEVEIYPISKIEQKQSRKKKKLESRLEQKNINDKNADQVKKKM